MDDHEEFFRHPEHIRNPAVDIGTTHPWTTRDVRPLATPSALLFFLGGHRETAGDQRPPTSHRPVAEGIISKATDYDAPRRPAIDLGEDDLDKLTTRTASARSPRIDADENDTPATFELPGDELSDDELTVTVVPMRSSEFRCARCFLVHNRSQLATHRDSGDICQECA